MTDIGMVLKNVILNGNYKLAEMIAKIDRMWADSKITDEEYDELSNLARTNISPESERPELLDTYKRLEEKYAALEARVAALEQGIDDPDDPVEPEEYPAWEPWSGVPGSGYKYGDKVSHKGVNYHSEFQGENVWEPGALGTETLWVVDE